MDRRHRSASRSRREERRSTASLKSSHESFAGNLSPGRGHPVHGHHGHSRRDSGGFFKSLFGGRRDKPPTEQYPPQQQLQQQTPHHLMSGSQPPSPPVNSSPGSKFKALLSFSPHRPPPRQAIPSSAGMPGVRMVEDNQAKGLQHTVEVLQENSKLMEARLAAEQRAAQEWKEKWNYQNFKLNLMVDMLVLRVLELEQPSAAGSR